MPTSRAVTIVLFILLGAVMLASPATLGAQAPPHLPAPPVDSAEAGHADGSVLMIGTVALTGSLQVDSLAVRGDDLGRSIDTFNVRRARIGLAGNLAPKVGWNVSGDLTAQPALRNAFLVFRFANQLHVRVGQANPLTSIERGTSPLLIELIDRSPVSNQLTAPLDIGLTVFNPVPFKRWLSYGVNVNNGSGFSRPDDNDAKDVSGRLAITPPLLKGLTVVGSATRGEQPAGLRVRSSFGFDYNPTRMRLLVEGLRQRRAGLPLAHGYLATLVYRLHPATVTPHFQMLELTARYSVLHDPASLLEGDHEVTNDDGTGDKSAGDLVSTTRELQFGGNYYVTRNMRAMGNLIVPMDDRIHIGTTMIARLQMVF